MSTKTLMTTGTWTLMKTLMETAPSIPQTKTWTVTVNSMKLTRTLTEMAY